MTRLSSLRIAHRLAPRTPLAPTWLACRFPLVARLVESSGSATLGVTPPAPLNITLLPDPFARLMCP